MPSLYALGILAVLLATSLGGNCLLWHSRDAAVAETATVQASYAQAQAAGKACSDGVVALAPTSADACVAAEALIRSKLIDRKSAN